MTVGEAAKGRPGGRGPGRRRPAPSRVPARGAGGAPSGGALRPPPAPVYDGPFREEDGMKAGDHLRALRTTGWDHAIDLGDRTVLRFVAGAGIVRTGLAEFAAGAPVEVVTHREPVFRASVVVDRAWSRLREAALAGMFHGAEQFATWCKSGQLPSDPASHPAAPPSGPAQRPGKAAARAAPKASPKASPKVSKAAPKVAPRAAPKARPAGRAAAKKAAPRPRAAAKAAAKKTAPAARGAAKGAGRSTGRAAPKAAGRKAPRPAARKAAKAAKARKPAARIRRKR